MREAIDSVIDSGWFVLGPEVEAFEREFAAASGVGPCHRHGQRHRRHRPDPSRAWYRARRRSDHVAALRCVYRARDPDDGRPSGLRRHRSRAHDARSVRPRSVPITPRTAALLPVHLYGQPADMQALAALASRKGLALIEDCCQAHLATCAGQPVGTFGAAGAFSFYPTKNLGALGDGGAVITSDAALAERIKRLRNGGQADRYRHVEAGVNSRLDELQAAILRARLPLLRTRHRTDGARSRRSTARASRARR